MLDTKIREGRIIVASQEHSGLQAGDELTKTTINEESATPADRNSKPEASNSPQILLHKICVSPIFDLAYLCVKNRICRRAKDDTSF